MNDKQVELKTCKVCGHVWRPKITTKKIYICPKCNSYRWNDLNLKNSGDLNE